MPHPKIKKVFESAVLGRDKMLCRMCGEIADVAYQIISKNAFPNKGYVLENGISLCDYCCEKASSVNTDDLEYGAVALYEKIGSSFLEALEKDDKKS